MNTILALAALLSFIILLLVFGAVFDRLDEHNLARIERVFNIHHTSTDSERASHHE